MEIAAAQREMRVRFAGGFYGQLVASALWFISAGLAVWVSSGTAIATLIAGGFLIFPVTELLVRAGGAVSLARENKLHELGMQVAFVLPFSMPLLLPVTRYSLNLFYPAMMILLGAHYIPFVFLYGMRVFAVLAALLLGGGVLLAMSGPHPFSAGAWYAAAVLLVFALAGRTIVRRERATCSA